MHLHVRRNAARFTGLSATADPLTLLYMHNETFSAPTLQVRLQEEHPACNTLVMVALWNRADHYIFILSFVLSSSFFLSSFFSSPNLTRRRLDVSHTSTHDVALVQI